MAVQTNRWSATKVGYVSLVMRCRLRLQEEYRVSYTLNSYCLHKALELSSF